MATATKERTGTQSASGITLPRTELLAHLRAVSKAVPSRPVRPILGNVRIGDGVVSGTDLELRIDVAIGEVCEPFLVPHGRLLQIVSNATGDEVTLTPAGTSVKVKCGRGAWTLPTEDAAEFPTWEPADLQPVCRLPADQFARAVRATAYATDASSSRFALGAVLCEVKGSNPTWVATDGRRLACVETECDQSVDDRQVLIPARAVEIAAGMDAGDDAVQVEANAKEVRFEVGKVVLTALTVQGAFPRWRDVVGEPEGDPSVLEVAELLAAVRSAAIVTSEQSKGVDLAWGTGTLTLSARSAEYGESKVKCGIVSAGTTSGTKLDPAFLAEFLSHLPSDEQPEVDVYATDTQSRVLLRCGDYTGVIMPLAAE